VLEAKILFCQEDRVVSDEVQLYFFFETAYISMPRVSYKVYSRGKISVTPNIRNQKDVQQKLCHSQNIVDNHWNATSPELSSGKAPNKKPKKTIYGDNPLDPNSTHRKVKRESSIFEVIVSGCGYCISVLTVAGGYCLWGCSFGCGRSGEF